jgi:hypothetical protein
MAYSVTPRKMSRALKTAVHRAWGNTTRVAALQGTTKTRDKQQEHPGAATLSKKTKRKRQPHLQSSSIPSTPPQALRGEAALRSWNGKRAPRCHRSICGFVVCVNEGGWLDGMRVGSRRVRVVNRIVGHACDGIGNGGGCEMHDGSRLGSRELGEFRCWSCWGRAIRGVAIV